MAKSERNYLFALLSKREYSKAELHQKLITRANLSDDDIQSLLNEFEEKGWQSDKRCAESIIRSYLTKPYGKVRIIQSLIYKKQIDAELVNSLLDDVNIDWLKQAEVCYQKKYANDIADDLKEKQRRVQYLIRRGFTQMEALSAIERK